MTELLPPLIDLARDAGRAVLEVYATEFAVHAKGDASPVTEADHRAEAIIVPALQSLMPAVPIVAEEAIAAGHIVTPGAQFWLVDALDGTREFIQRNGEFTVNIALVHDGVPVLGVVYAPALGRLFAGSMAGGAFTEDAGGRRSIACRAEPAEGAVVLASRSHGDAADVTAFLAGRKVASVATMGSSIKLCLIAAGEADLYPRFSPTMEWDTAAGHAVLAAAGGQLTDPSGAPLRYGKAGFCNPHFIATGRRP